jgi:hypothetical protein
MRRFTKFEPNETLQPTPGHWFLVSARYRCVALPRTRAAQPERSASPDACQLAGSNRAPGGLPLRFLSGVGLFVWIRWRAFLSSRLPGRPLAVTRGPGGGLTPTADVHILSMYIRS